MAGSAWHPDQPLPRRLCMQCTTWLFFFPPCVDLWPCSATGHYKEGTLVVDLFDAKTKPLIWRGRSEDMLSTKAEKKEPGKGHSIFCYFPAHRCGVMR